MGHGTNKPLTYFVGEPRDEPCSKVNPHLWNEFKSRNLHLFENDEFYTEAFCVQWLDMYYYEEQQDDLQTYYSK